MPCTLFVADLHLEARRPEATRQFLQLLGGRARRADALYILGDLFEAWIGDDDDSPLAATVCDALKACTRAGACVFVMHGNRDFLLGREFLENSGTSLLEDPSIIELYGERALLMHGDLLCTDDAPYQAFRRQVRDPHWQRDFLARPLAERRRLAAGMRDASRAETAQKPEDIMDVSMQAVSGVLQRYGVQILIHGHTHRPAIHEFRHDDRPVRRIVLGDWYTDSSLLECTPRGCRLESPVSG